MNRIYLLYLIKSLKINNFSKRVKDYYYYKKVYKIINY